MFRTGNPAFKNPAFRDSAQSWDDLEAQGRFSDDTRAKAAVKAGNASYMTLQGAVNKTMFTLSLCAVSAIACWNVALTGSAESISFTPLGGILTFAGAIVGFILSLVIIFRPKTAPFMAPVYAVCEGLFVGGISAVYALFMTKDAPVAESAIQAHHQIVTAGATSLNTQLIFNAVLLTFGIAGGVLAAYSAKLIRPNKMFYNVVIAGTMGVCLYALVAMGASFFGSFSLISVYDPHNGGAISVGFSLLLVALASANLVLDFDLINNAAKNRAPKYMEWYGAFAILVTLVWLYIEVLRLLAKLQSRD